MQPILLVGASVRALAQSVVRGGWSVCSADLFADQDLRSLGPTRIVKHYPGDLRRLPSQVRAGSWMYAGAVENYPQLIDALTQHWPLLGNPGHVVRQVRDPGQVYRVLSDAGLPVPGLADSSGSSECERWLQKPRRSAAGHGIRQVVGRPQKWTTPASDHYFQQFIAGRPASAVFVAAQGTARLIGCTEQLVGVEWHAPHPFGYAGSWGPLDLGEQHQRQIRQLGKTLSRAFDLRGLFGVDFMMNREGCWTVEVNPRYTASVEVLERAYAFNAASLHIPACLQQLLPGPMSPVGRSWGKLIVFAEQACVAGPGLTTLVQRWSGGRRHFLADIPKTSTPFEPGQPIATVFAGGRNGRQVIRRLMKKRAWLLAAVRRRP